MRNFQDTFERPLCEKRSNAKFFLVCIFRHSDWIRRYRVSLRIQSDGGKIRTQKDSVFGHFWRSGRKQSFISALSCLCSFCAMLQNCRDRSSRPVVFCKKGVLKALMRRATLLKKRLWHRCFPVNFLKFLRIPFLQNTSRGCFYWIFYPWD